MSETSGRPSWVEQSAYWECSSGIERKLSSGQVYQDVQGHSKSGITYWMCLKVAPVIYWMKELDSLITSAEYIVQNCKMQINTTPLSIHFVISSVGTLGAVVGGHAWGWLQQTQQQAGQRLPLGPSFHRRSTDDTGAGRARNGCAQLLWEAQQLTGSNLGILERSVWRRSFYRSPSECDLCNRCNKDTCENLTLGKQESPLYKCKELQLPDTEFSGLNTVRR